MFDIDNDTYVLSYGIDGKGVVDSILASPFEGGFQLGDAVTNVPLCGSKEPGKVGQGAVIGRLPAPKFVMVYSPQETLVRLKVVQVTPQQSQHSAGNSEGGTYQIKLFLLSQSPVVALLKMRDNIVLSGEMLEHIPVGRFLLLRQSQESRWGCSMILLVGKERVAVHSWDLRHGFNWLIE